MRSKILLVEDDTTLAETLKDFFEEEGIDVALTHDGSTAMTLYRQHRPDLILSDVALPNKDGFEIIKEIREIDKEIPVILMTGSEIDTNSQIKGYESGAINYILKPIVPQVLLAQVIALLHTNKTKTYQIKDYTISLNKQLLKVNDQQIILRDKDSRILEVLLENLDSVTDRKIILFSVWGDDHPRNNNFLDKAMYRLKNTLRIFPDIQIKSVYANGYILTGNDV